MIRLTMCSTITLEYIILYYLCSIFFSDKGLDMVVLRGGTHYITDTIHLTPDHSNLHILGHPGEEAVVSGGVELNVTWVPYNVTNKGAVRTIPFTNAPATTLTSTATK